MEYPRQTFRKKDDRFADRNPNPPTDKPDWSIRVKPEWITNEIDRDGIEFTKNLGKYLAAPRSEERRVG